jgi:cytochrome b
VSAETAVARQDADTASVRVWDLPVRICHWSFVALLPVLWWTAENSEMGWHMRAGTLLLALVMFRILWGFVGSSTARFTSFVKGPGAVITYLRSIRNEHGKVLGHNAAGGWSVVALLLVLGTQASLGLFAGDPFDGATGPLNDLVGVTTAGQLTDWHETLFNVILALVGLHIAAIAFYLLGLGDNLIRPMISGRRSAAELPSAMAPVSAWRALACAAVAAGVALWVYNGAPGL